MPKVWDRVLTSYSLNSAALKVVRYYGTFRRLYAFLEESQWWSKDHIQDYQLEQVRALLHHAYAHVPYYRNMFHSLQWAPKDIECLSDLQKLPFLTKELIQNNVSYLKATNYPASSFEWMNTGGSTGFPLEFYVEKGIWQSRLMAYTKMMNQWANVGLLDKCVLMTGRDKPWNYQLLRRILVLSSYYMTDENLPRYIDKIRRLQPKYFLTYPSAITILVNYMKEHHLEMFRSVKTVVCHGETLYDWQRELVEESFGCRVHDQYGHREQTALGATCECSNFYHMFPEYSVVELIDESGNPVMKEDAIGEIVATGFHTAIFPFLRYRTGDLGVYTSQTCKCGRNYPLLKRIEGRVLDFVVSKHKRLMPFTRVQHLVVSVSHNVRECQFYQDAEGEIVLNVVKKEGYSEHDTTAIHSRFHQMFGDEFDLTIHFVDQIPRTKRGKYQFIIQKLPIDFSSYKKSN